MQFYNEEKMKNLRLKIEKEVLSWSNVTTKKCMVAPAINIKKNYLHFLLPMVLFLPKPVNKIKLDYQKNLQLSPSKQEQE
jgi:hypothetical protein